MNPLPDHLKPFFADKEPLRRAMNEANRKTGFVPDPVLATLTAEQTQECLRELRQSMRDSGIRAEDNIFTCLLYKMRDGEDDV